MKFFDTKDIYDLQKIFRINLVNSCSGFKSANLLGSISEEGIANVAIFSSVTHLGSSPPTLGFILRPTTIPRDTYKNIKALGVFTINHIWEDIIEEAHHTSAKYSEEISEFDMTGLEPEFKGNFKAPFVKNAPVQMSMKFVEEIYVPSNDVILIVAQIQELYVKDELLQEDGFINLSKGKVATINGLDGYSIPVFKNRFEYQRPKDTLINL
ncbi:MAG: flavin reductase [Flavobacteriia bacterium]|nr:flavin reductase [Flavobacteriia bacterium]OIP47416.1 MAG: flavin oxidoreductase [Flavobacteriaceae bacterium CG2_30_31_66]PIV96858.1 MAG: flavin oxidoreductase [Flavobacteriaceae bacterium CG17_big_fil_post_rev_8_21_14_2_50_31_13]PIX14669.1 MAG: flavin oxidoreductase [Flavobacteriaceae bacterium CG_4_8_14_3_um_filter_31_8]PIY15680.1 MAG: flavin oxidoreductase [Flavobacteriaceae bacterium CG_4_10_14_3_um_filter_31_253]PIZ09521.1 MAG: flavin oxidoreductase [Flavobacteriaceae bacterium CG_4_1